MALLDFLNNTGNKLTGTTGKNADGTEATGLFGLTKGGTQLASGVLTAGSGLVNNLLNSSGNTTGVGSALSSVGSLASQIPGVGGLIGGGISAVGGLVNAAFGSKINTQFVNSTNNSIEQQKNAGTGAQSNEDLMSQASSTGDLTHVTRSQVGSQGLFSNKATRTANSLNDKIDKANFTMNKNLANSSNNIGTNTENNLESSYYSDGGSLSFINELWKKEANTFAGGGYLPSDSIKSRVTQWEGSSLKTNLPMRTKANEVAEITPNFNLLSPNQKDALFSYYYNIKPSTYKKNIVPLMSKLGALNDEASKASLLNTVADNINVGLGRPEMTGLTKRRLYEQGLFRSDSPIQVIQPQIVQPQVTSTDNQAPNFNFSQNTSVPSNYTDMSITQPEDITQNNLVSPVNSKIQYDSNTAHVSANGGPINIDPANKGKFNATMKRTGKTAHELLHSKNPLTRKRANFAINFGHKKEDGGDLNLTNGGVFSNGVTSYDTGGTHEQNPNGGIPQGVASDGKPNLVEQGEVKYNDYIYSNRHNPNKELLNILGLNSSYNKGTFADAAKKVSAESKERPNDPISKTGLKANMQKLQALEELQRMATEKGSPTNTPSPNGQNVGDNTNPNVHADGDYLNYVQNYPDSYNPSNYTSWDKSNQRANALVPNNTNQFSTNAVNSLVNSKVDLSGIHVLPNATVTATAPVKKETKSVDDTPGVSGLAGLRYAPAIGSGLQAMSDILGVTNKPDYSNADMIGNVVNHLPMVSAKPVGDYVGYSPFDTQFYQNKLSQQTATTNNQIMNNSGGNRAAANAALMANNYNYGQNVGNLARQAQEENLNQKLQAANFNRGTNEYNSDAALRAAMSNQNMSQLALTGRTQEAQLRDAQQRYSSAAKSSNLSNFVTNLGSVGTDTFWRNAANSNPAISYLMGNNGNVLFKALANLTEQQKQSKALEAAKGYNNGGQH